MEQLSTLQQLKRFVLGSDARVATNRTAGTRDNSAPSSSPRKSKQAREGGGGQQYKLSAGVKIIPHPDKVSNDEGNAH